MIVEIVVGEGIMWVEDGEMGGEGGGGGRRVLEKLKHVKYLQIFIVTKLYFFTFFTRNLIYFDF